MQQCRLLENKDLHNDYLCPYHKISPQQETQDPISEILKCQYIKIHSLVTDCPNPNKLDKEKREPHYKTA